MPPTTTMKRIAGELGVSITTVSKVLNNRDDIGHATRARVLAKVAELGYQPQRRRPQPDAAPHPHPRRRHSGPDALVLRRDRRRPRAGGERARLRAAALQLERGPGARSAQELEMLRQRQVDGIVLGSANASGNTDLLQQLGRARHRPRDDRPRRPSRRPLRPRRHRRRGGRAAGDGAPHRRRGGARSRTSPAPPIVHAKRRADGYRAALQGARRASRGPSGSSAAASWRRTATAR